MEKETSLKNKLIYWFVSIFIFIIPLFFLPITPSVYAWNKSVLALASGIILLLLWSGISVFKKEESITARKSQFTLLVGAFLAVTALSIFLNPGVMEGLMGEGILFLGLVFIYFVLSQIKEFSFRYIFYPLLTSSLLLSFLSILGNVGILAQIWPWENVNPETWTPAGSQFAQLVWLVVTLALAIFYLIKYAREGGTEHTNTRVSTAEAITIGVTLPLLLTALALFGINYQKTGATISQEPELEIQTLQEGGPYLNLPYKFGWRIATSSLGNNLKNTFIGVGPNNFTSAFRQFKPLEIARGQLWQVTFNNSSNVPFHLLTTLGILGFGIWLLIAVKTSVVFLKKGRELHASDVGLMVVLATQILLPPTLLSWVLLFVFLAVNKLHQDKQRLALKSSTTFFVVLLLASGLTYLAYRAYQGELTYYRSLQAFQNNDGIQIYNLQQKAIQTNPKKVSYHLAFSNTNLLLAQAFLDDLNQQTAALQQEQQSLEQNQEELEAQLEQLRNQINVLIQQSIDQAKQAVALNQQEAGTWSNLASTYENLQSVLDGAADWAIAAHSEAINLDPLNPNPRLQRGRIFFSQGEYEDAILDFRTAIQIRARYVPGWYNLAQAYRMEEKYPRAAQALENVLTILPTDHEDRPQIEDELEKIKAELSTEEKEALEEGTEAIESRPLPQENMEENVESPTEPEEESSPSAEPEPQVEGSSSFSPFGN